MVHSKLSQRIKGLPTLVKGLLISNEHFKGWQPLRQLYIQPCEIRSWSDGDRQTR